MTKIIRKGMNKYYLESVILYITYIFNYITYVTFFMKLYSLILLSWKAKWLGINFLIYEAWADRDLLHSTSLSLALESFYPRQRNQKINFAQTTFHIEDFE